MRETLRAGGRERDVVALPVRVEAQVARGATPAQAASGLARAAAAGAPGHPKSPDQGPTRLNPDDLLEGQPLGLHLAALSATP